MLTDPLSITYNGSAKSLARVTGPSRIGSVRALSASRYGTADGEFVVDTRQGILGNNDRVSEFILTRTSFDTDTNTVMQGLFANSVGFTFVTNPYRVNTAVDVPLIRAALLSVVDSTLQGRIINGEH